jgi:hypothetical protein
VPALWVDPEEMEKAGWIVKSYFYQEMAADSSLALEEVAMCNSRRGQKLLPDDYFFIESTSSLKLAEIFRRFGEKGRHWVGFSIHKEDYPEWENYDFDKELYVKVIGHINVENVKTGEI